ncbi:MAG: tRNA glutamyl-Q(34) synthetase GluQRS [Rhodoferax sp.]|nr:tRNA glutamyl-Q(34) synthetase GluQRS [Rhodoferax sp.]
MNSLRPEAGLLHMQGHPNLLGAVPPVGAAPCGSGAPAAKGPGSTSYIGRFAPSPTGPLHAGSLVAALASWLDARAHGGQWLVRIEDVDSTRCLPGLDQTILQQLAALGLHSDQPPVYQTQRTPLYQQALDQLIATGQAYPCGCSRRDIELALQQHGQVKSRHGELVYPGTCRTGLQGKAARAWRFNVQALPPLHWQDRRLGGQSQDVAAEVGDFILKRADGCFAYQLAVVVDDAAQGITDVVRGEDLTDNTARQILLQRALNLPTPRYLHTPLVLGSNGEKLSKQNGAQALDTDHPLVSLNQAAALLGLAEQYELADALANWVAQWRASVRQVD